ncbi:MAG TPA: hypothetical protein VNF28_03565 [Candidatus Binataceae bacterium]|nr:hypothetical protein [Candidatus Binataceae bacterium]
MPSVTLNLDPATYEKLQDLAGGDIHATAMGLLSAALDHTTRDFEMKLTRQRFTQERVTLEKLLADFSTHTEAVFEQLLRRIADALEKLAAGERRLTELLSVGRFVVHKSGPPWRRKVELLAAPVQNTRGLSSGA